ncbi:Uncharacterized protein QTN25_010231 [Entamoeba marina]
MKQSVIKNNKTPKSAYDENTTRVRVNRVLYKKLDVLRKRLGNLTINQLIDYLYSDFSSTELHKCNCNREKEHLCCDGDHQCSPDCDCFETGECIPTCPCYTHCFYYPTFLNANLKCICSHVQGSNVNDYYANCCETPFEKGKPTRSTEIVSCYQNETSELYFCFHNDYSPSSPYPF